MLHRIFPLGGRDWEGEGGRGGGELARRHVPLVSSPAQSPGSPPAPGVSLGSCRRRSEARLPGREKPRRSPRQERTGEESPEIPRKPRAGRAAAPPGPAPLRSAPLLRALPGPAAGRRGYARGRRGWEGPPGSATRPSRFSSQFPTAGTGCSRGSLGRRAWEGAAGSPRLWLRTSWGALLPASARPAEEEEEEGGGKGRGGEAGSPAAAPARLVAHSPPRARHRGARQPRLSRRAPGRGLLCPPPAPSSPRQL